MHGPPGQRKHVWTFANALYAKNTACSELSYLEITTSVLLELVLNQV